MSTTYKVYVTPRTSYSTYGTEVEITDMVLSAGLKELSRSIDSSDYDVGIFAFDDVTLRCDNSFGRLGDYRDSRSIFQYRRDLAKVRIVYSDDSGDTITFRGLLNDEATRDDIKNSEISFRILSRDSVLRKSKVNASTITSGIPFSSAFFIILNSPEITRVLNVSTGNINVGNDFLVDDGSQFDNLEKQTALNQLLFVSNSVMLIDASDNIIIRSRAHDTANPPLELFGPGDLLGRENIIDISEYNSGLHRMFNSIKVNDVATGNATSISEFGAKQKSISIPFLTDTENTKSICNDLVSEWAWPKRELSVSIRTSIAKDYDLFDRVSISYPLLAQPYGKFLPICGITKCGSVAEPLPYVTGSVVISPEIGFKIIEIKEDPSEFVTTLKLREIGTTPDDGTL